MFQHTSPPQHIDVPCPLHARALFAQLSPEQTDLLKPKKDITAAFHKYLAVILGERTEAAEDAMFTRKVRASRTNVFMNTLLFNVQYVQAGVTPCWRARCACVPYEHECSTTVRVRYYKPSFA